MSSPCFMCFECDVDCETGYNKRQDHIVGDGAISSCAAHRRCPIWCEQGMGLRTTFRPGVMVAHAAVNR